MNAQTGQLVKCKKPDSSSFLTEGKIYTVHGINGIDTRYLIENDKGNMVYYLMSDFEIWYGLESLPKFNTLNAAAKKMAIDGYRELEELFVSHGYNAMGDEAYHKLDLKLSLFATLLKEKGIL